MKLKSVLVFGVVIVLLTSLAIADPDVQEYELKFKGEGSFEVTPVGLPEDGVYTLSFKPPGGSELLNVSHLGLSEVMWELLVTATNPLDPATYEFLSGTFTITGANGRDGLEGIYSEFEIDVEAGEYDLDWNFIGGMGRMAGAGGIGHTDGLVDFETSEAKFKFSGDIIVPKGKAVITSVVRDGVTEGQPEIVAGPSPGGLQEGSHAFMDRPLDPDDTRNYHWEGIPAELIGADYVMTYNEDKQPWYDPKVYNVSYAVTLGKAAKLYIFVDDRYAPFAWLTDSSAGAVFVDTGLDIMLNEVGGRNVLQHYDVYGAKVPAGTYVLGPSCDGSADRSFYSIAAAK